MAHTTSRPHRHVVLSVAAAMAYRNLSGRLEIVDVAKYSDFLNFAAMALAEFAPVYGVARHARVRISRKALCGGSFQRAATEFRSNTGGLYKSLSMRTEDMVWAISQMIQARAAGPQSVLS